MAWKKKTSPHYEILKHRIEKKNFQKFFYNEIVTRQTLEDSKNYKNDKESFSKFIKIKKTAQLFRNLLFDYWKTNFSQMQNDIPLTFSPSFCLK